MKEEVLQVKGRGAKSKIKSVKEQANNNTCRNYKQE